MKQKDIKLLNHVGGAKFREYSRAWHELELISDGKELRNNCVLCHQPGLGPTYKCIKSDDYDCEFVLHEACARRPHPHPQEMKPKVDLTDVVSHMMLIKEVEMENNEKIVCSLCDDPISISGSSSAYYKCLTPNFTNFCLHQSCAHVPLYLRRKEHPAHRDCDTLLLSLGNGHCGLCGKICNIYYYCHVCKTEIDVKCALLCLVRVENCNPHKFGTKLKDVGQLTCEACGRQSDEIIFICSNCRLIIHKKCVDRYLLPVKTKGCDHFLSCTFSLSPGQINCRFCEDLVDKRYAAYICNICGYVAHLLCAHKFLDSRGIAQLVDKTRSLEVIERHFSHPQHNLILDKKQPQHGQRCMGCMDHIFSPPFYNCIDCNFFLHERCAKLPFKFNFPLIEGMMVNLLQRLSFDDQTCHICQRTFSGFACFHDREEKSYYKIHGFDEAIADIQCSLLRRELQHKSHQHSLFFEKTGAVKCNACNEVGLWLWYFRCGFCNFNLCVKCVTYPPQIWHKDDEHPLNLSDKVENNSKEYYCLICELKRDFSHWFYYCSLCDFATHLECAYSRKY